MNIILASASPRRKELLQKIVEDFLIIPSECDEIVEQGTPNEQVAEQLSYLKAISVWKNHKDDLVIAADTIVLIDNEVLGKPKNYDEAKIMLEKLSGKQHEVITGVSIMSQKVSTSFSVTTKVKFSKLTQQEIKWYVNTKEPMDKAGAYGIQGYGSLFIEGIIGDYFNVMGLPCEQLYKKLKLVCPENIKVNVD